MNDQDAMGWHNFMFGRISNGWVDTQQRYLERLGKKQTGKRWAAAIIEKVWEISWNMWQHRNHIKHNTLHPRRAAEMAELDRSLSEAYDRGNSKLLGQDQQLFAKTKHKLLKGTFIEKSQWIASVAMGHQKAKRAKEDYNASLEAERTLMTRWIGPGT